MTEDKLCRFNHNVLCGEHRCEGCGWEPREKQRRQALARQLERGGILRLTGRSRAETPEPRPGQKSGLTDRQVENYIRKHERGFGGTMTQREAAETMGISTARYYKIRKAMKK